MGVIAPDEDGQGGREMEKNAVVMVGPDGQVLGE